MPFDYFLRIDGIPGESPDAKHKGEITVQSFSWGEEQGASLVGGGGGASKTKAGPLNVTARTSKASPLLLIACATGQHIKSATLSVRKAGGKGSLDFLTYALSDVTVIAYEVGGDTADGPADQFKLAFAQIVVEYREQNPDGSPGAVTHAGWDIKANKKL
jgi:type VI secretion system secreted protein Hcp